jgi:4'-phosphopantetheinyl transferase
LVNIIYTTFITPLSKVIFETYLKELPLAMQEKNAKYLRWQDKHAHVLGRLLLIKELQKFGYDKTELLKIKYTDYGKPYLENDLEFNISHTENLVTLAINKTHALGIDVELIKPIVFENFNEVMTANEWRNINSATNKTEAFFKHWVTKESVIKADGKGLSIPLLDIKIEDENKIKYKNKVWYIQALQLEENYRASLATNQKAMPYTIERIDYTKLLNA